MLENLDKKLEQLNEIKPFQTLKNALEIHPNYDHLVSDLESVVNEAFISGFESCLKTSAGVIANLVEKNEKA